MRNQFATLALVALALTGCAVKVSTGGGDVTRLTADLQACARETFAFTLIPDLGFTADHQRAKCMKERGWLWDLASGVNDWAWIGPGSVKQLARYQDGREQITPICWKGLACQPVVPTAEHGEWAAWAYEAWGESQYRRANIVIVGDQEQCESVRARDAAKEIPTKPCTGPLYFKREGAPDAPRIAAPIASVPAISPATATWATGE